MGFDARDVENADISGSAILAAMIQGENRGAVSASTSKNKSVTVRLDLEVLGEIDDFADKAGITRTAVIELSLVDFIRQVKGQMAINEELYDLSTQGDSEQ